MQHRQRATPRIVLSLIALAGTLISGPGCSLVQPPTLRPDGVVQNWLVLRPIPISGQDGNTPDDADQQAFARDWLLAEGGEAAIQPRPGMKLTINDQPLTWQRVGSKNGAVDLHVAGHPRQHVLAYACAEFDQPQARKAFLGIGSDDGVKVWLNGKLVHENWTNREVRLDDDLVPVELERGRNRLLLKVQNGSGPWGLGCRLMSEDEGQAILAVNRLILAQAEGDAAGIRAFYHATSEEEVRKFEASAALYGAIARMRKAFDDTYGPGRLVRLGFRCRTPNWKLPPRPNFQINGNRATFSPRFWSPITLTKVDGAWKGMGVARPEEVSRAANGRPLLAPEGRLANMRAMGQVLDAIAADVRADRYLSAADAFGVLNARLHGLAASLEPLVLAATVDLAAPATQPTAASIPIIELRGDGTVIGKAYGSQQRDEIRLVKRDYLDHLLSPLDAWFTFGLVRQAVLGRASEFKPYIRPEHLEEIRALGAGAGLSFREALLAQCFVDMKAGSACSTIALPASASSDGVARFGRNLDFFSLNVLDKHSILLVVHPKDCYAFVAVTWPGLVGVLSGMNEHGLSLGCMEVPRPARKPDAMPYMLLYRTVLEHCKTVDEAIAFLEKTPRQTANSLMLTDASGDRAVAEITPAKVTVRRAPDTAALISTNHHRGTNLDIPGLCKRFDYLHDAARRQFGQLSEAAVEEILTGCAQGDQTLQSMVFEPANRVLYLAVGAGAPNHGFVRIDLKPYFR